MTQETLAIIAVGIVLAGILISGQRIFLREMNGLKIDALLRENKWLKEHISILETASCKWR